MGKVFINKNKKLRSGWKILITLLGAIALNVVISSLITIGVMAYKLIDKLTFSEIFVYLKNEFPMSEIVMLIQPMAFITSCFVFWKLFEKKPFSAIGLASPSKHWKEVVFGGLLGIISIGSVFGIIYFTGTIKVTSNLGYEALVGSMLYGLVMFIMVGFSEEIFSRGYCMNVLKQTNSKVAVIVISSVIFSLLHGMNPNVTLIGFLNIFLIGLLFAYMFIKTERLFIPIGYHITWNFFQGYIIGFQVSGIKTEGLFKVTLFEENLINGGLFGAEGGLATTVAIILGFILTKLFTNRRLKVQDLR